MDLKQHLDNGVVGFPTALASTVGLIQASPVILTATMGFGLGGSTFVMAVILSFLMMLCQSTTFSEAAAILPTTGSVYDYISCGLGRFFGIVGTLTAYVLVMAFAGTSEAVLSGVMATVNFDVLHNTLEAAGMEWMVGIGLFIVFAVLNIFGITVFSRAEVVLTFGMFSTLMIFGITGLIKAPLVQLDGFFGTSMVGTDLNTILSFIGMAMFMFVGAEYVTPLAPELKNSARNIPKAMYIGLTAVFVCLLIYGAAVSRQVANVALDAEGTVHLLDTPLAIPMFANQVMGPIGKIWIGIGFLCAGCATINTMMAGLPRLLYGMAVDGALPKIFGYLHPRFKTPVFSIVVACLIPCAPALYVKGDVDRLMPLILAAVCCWGVAYLMVTLSVVVLRIRRPDLPRAYRAPLYPLPQILSSVGIVIAMCYIAPPGMNPMDIYLPFGVMLGLTALYALVWTVFVQRSNPFIPVPVEQILAEEFEGADPIFTEPLFSDGEGDKAIEAG